MTSTAPARQGHDAARRPTTKAVIPAAGLGTRFLPATKATPKEMLPVVDRPAIQYVVEEAVAAGLEDVLMITGRSKRALEDHFDRNAELEASLQAQGKDALLRSVQASNDLGSIHYVRQGDPRGLGHAVLCAAQHVGDEPVRRPARRRPHRPARPGAARACSTCRPATAAASCCCSRCPRSRSRCTAAPR